MNIHEEQLILNFLDPNKKERFLELLGNPKRRDEFLKSLGHFHDLDKRWRLEISGAARQSGNILELLDAKGAPKKCWVISESSKLDGRTMVLGDALDEAVCSDMGTFISCLPGKLAYLDNEDGGWLLQR